MRTTGTRIVFQSVQVKKRRVCTERAAVAPTAQRTVSHIAIFEQEKDTRNRTLLFEHPSFIKYFTGKRRA